jgi:hypothetical protein
MSVLIRAALLGGIAFLITRALSGQSSHHRRALAGGRSLPRGDMHPSQSHIWPTSESQERAAADVGPSS